MLEDNLQASKQRAVISIMFTHLIVLRLSCELTASINELNTDSDNPVEPFPSFGERPSPP